MTTEDFKQYGIHCPEKGIFIIILISKWCKSCKLLSIILEKIRDEGSIELRKIDIGEIGHLARTLNIHAIPALLFFKDGKLLNRDISIHGESIVNKGILVGSFNEMILKEVIRQIKIEK